jgi:hypothetical protein
VCQSLPIAARLQQQPDYPTPHLARFPVGHLSCVPTWSRILGSQLVTCSLGSVCHLSAAVMVALTRAMTRRAEKSTSAWSKHPEQLLSTARPPATNPTDRCAPIHPSHTHRCTGRGLLDARRRAEMCMCCGRKGMSTDGAIDQNVPAPASVK